MGIKLNGSTSGYVELDAPATAGNNTLRMPTSNGSAGQSMTTDGAGNLSFGSSIVSGTAQNSTSGTAIDFTGIPSWAKRITVMFSGVSTSGTADLLVQIGSGSVQNSGYASTTNQISTASGSGGTNSTSGFVLRSASAASLVSAQMVLTLVSGNTWVASHNGKSSTALTIQGGGDVSLSGTLDRVRITTTGTDTFDAGSINILYE